MKKMSDSLHRFSMRSIATLRVIGRILNVTASIAACIGLCALVIYSGFEHPAHELADIRKALRFVQAIFLINIVFHLMFRECETPRRRWTVMAFVDLPMLLTLLPLLYPRPVHPWIPVLEQILYSNWFHFSAIALYSIVTLSYGVMRIIGKRTSPALLLSSSFLIFIFIGSLLLMLPKCTYGPIDYVDALFVSTSAVCITGLTPIDISVHFTPLGLLVLAGLIQIGGLGVMTFTSFFALFFSGNTSIYSQLMLKDMIYSRSMSSLVPTLMYILGFTVAVELIGAAAIWLSVHGTLGLTPADDVIFALFNSLSAFCNAGFSNLPQGMANPLLLYGNMSIYWIMTALIVAGAIGFPILVNFKDAIIQCLHNLHSRITGNRAEIRAIHIYGMNTKIVLSFYMILLVAGAAAFFCLEYNNTMQGMDIADKVTQSVFNSATPRSAGFVSLNPARFMNVTLLIVLFLMWIGGASQSTGGGIKVNTFAAIWYNLIAILRGREKVTAFHRTISYSSIRRANAVVAISILAYVIYSTLLLALEPNISARELLFESCSALFTVGSSLGATSQLSDASLLLLSTAMFLGRVGIISLLTGVFSTGRKSEAHYPSDNIIIN